MLQGTAAAAMARLQGLKGDGSTVLRVKQHEHRRGVPVGRRQPEGEALEDDSEHDFGLKEGQVLADARPGPQPEGKKSHRVLRRPRHSVREPAGVELGRVVPPQPRVVVNGQYGNEELRAGRNPVAAEHGVGLGPAYRRHRGWVQPQRLVQDHAYLRPKKEGEHRSK